jgi:ABC-type lipoprotein release transport system permease subunit
LTTLLYDVRPSDFATFALGSLLLAGVALAATYIPARKAASTSPLDALRSE